MPTLKRQKQIIGRAAHKYGIQPAILWGLYGAESNFGKNHNDSSAGAQGPFQFMPGTAAGMHINPHNFKQAAFGAAKYLSQYKDRGVDGMLAAYNAGPAGNPNNPETRAYVPKVKQLAASWTGAGGGGSGSGSEPSPRPASNDTGGGQYTIPGVDNSPLRQQALLGYLQERGRPGALLSLKSSLDAVQDVSPRTVQYGNTNTNTQTVRKNQKVARPSAVQDIMAEAQLINAAHVDYQWGGGHQQKILHGSKVTPLDCSGAVSRVLGLNPMVASQFKSWGKPGRGSRVTIYAKDTHVLMSIRDEKGVEHFFGTSKSNKGGGAGWISRNQLSSSYLSGFVARHPAGM